MVSVNSKCKGCGVGISPFAVHQSSQMWLVPWDKMAEFSWKFRVRVIGLLWILRVVLEYIWWIPGSPSLSDKWCPILDQDSDFHILWVSIQNETAFLNYTLPRTHIAYKWESSHSQGRRETKRFSACLFPTTPQFMMTETKKMSSPDVVFLLWGHIDLLVYP